MASDLNGETASPVVFDDTSEPDTDVAYAVAASIAIPGVFAPLARRDRDQLLVDGGLLMNFPVRLLEPLAAQGNATL